MPNQISSEPDSSIHVAYLLKMFPRLSETFILNEVLELERQGAKIDVFSLMAPGDGRFHGNLSQLKLAVRCVPREKPESLWSKIWNLEPGLVPPLEQWETAVEFIRRNRFPRDLDMLLRALLIGAQAKSLGVQHFHAHFATISTRMAALVNLLYQIPFSFTCHAKDIFRETVDRRLFKELVDLSTFAITVSDFNRNYIIEKTPDVDPDKIIRLYNGINLDFFEPSIREPETDPVHMISVGRLVPKKGFDHLLQALSILQNKGVKFKATIVGDGEEETKLQEMSHRLQLDQCVHFTGGLSIEEVRKHCAESAMMVLACVPDADGNMDALPTVLLEALALDLPIVTTTLTGCPEIVGEDAGLLVEPANPQALADAIERITLKIKNGELVKGTARNRAQRLFDLSTNVSTLRGHFERSISKNC